MRVAFIGTRSYAGRVRQDAIIRVSLPTLPTYADRAGARLAGVSESTDGRRNPMRNFDPVRLGAAEADAWVAYYQRRWTAFLRAAVSMVRIGFAMSGPRSIRGAWYVLRANQLWAPFPDNDAAGAQAQMLRFYRLVARVHREAFDVDEAARLEIGWWRAHRELQHIDAYPDATQEALVIALTDLYAHVYGEPAMSVRPAAVHRAEAMRISDAWVADGCDSTSLALDLERSALVSSYTALRAAVGGL